MEWKEHRARMDEALTAVVIPYLRAKGFKGSLPHFRRRGETHTDILGFQFSQWGPQFYIEIAVCPPEGITLVDGSHRPADRIKYYQCHKRAQIGEDPFNFENGAYQAIASQVIEYLQAAEEWWLTTDPHGQPSFQQLGRPTK